MIKFITGVFHIIKGVIKINETKKLKLMVGGLLWFLIYMLILGVLVIFSMFTGYWHRLIDLGLYIGNVVAFGLSFYTMNQGKKMKMPFLVVAGVCICLVNAWGIVRFYL